MGSAPGFILTLVRPKGLLAEVLADGMDENMAWEMASVVNKVIMADRIEMGDVEQVGAVISKVDAYLNLALEWLAGQDVAAARECLEQLLLRRAVSSWSQPDAETPASRRHRRQDECRSLS